MAIENHQEGPFVPDEISAQQGPFDNALELIFELTLEGQIVNGNQTFKQFTGWNPRGDSGRRLESLVHPADIQRLRLMLKQAGDRGNPEFFEIRLRSEEGTELPLECSAFRIVENVRTGKIMVLGRDISNRKRREEALFESDAKLRSVLESANDAIVFIGSDLEVLSWNRAAQQVFGHTEEIHGKPFEILLTPRHRSHYRETIRQLQEGGESLLLGKTLELNGCRADGTEFPLELSLAVWMFRGKPIFAAIIRDITKRKLAEEALQKKNNLMQLIQEITIASNQAVNPEEALKYALERICSYSGWPIGHVYLPVDGKPKSTAIWHLKDGMSLENFKQAGERQINLPNESLPGRVIHEKKSIWIKDVTQDRNFQRADAAVEAGLKAAFAMPVLKGSDVAAVLEFFSASPEETDPEMTEGMEIVGAQLGRVFERDEALTKTKKVEERLRALAAHLADVREEERIRVAREVHDDLGQVLSALKMELTLLNQSLMESSEMAPREQILQELGTMSKLVDDTIHSVRHIITELRPEEMDHLDIASALEEQVRQFRVRTGIKASYRSTLTDTPLDQKGRTAIFRILQETLTNVLRHSQATSVDVKLIDNEESIILEVKDNGRGITEEDTKKSGSFGIMGMRERVLLLGGTIEMTGAPNKGTTVTVKIPLSENR
jgi:PAS domain S-box-containing protein